MYDYDGQDWSAGSAAATTWSLSLPKRVAKQNYDENDFKARESRVAGARMPKQMQVNHICVRLYPYIYICPYVYI